MVALKKVSLWLLAAYSLCLYAPHPGEMPFIKTIKGRKRATTGQFISGDNYRAIADHILDEDSPSINPAQVKLGDVIFVSSFYMEDFFDTVHPHIENKYVLITMNGDRSIPGGKTVNQSHYRDDCGISRHLDDPKVAVWFTQNMDAYHPKLVPIPIGIESRRWGKDYATAIAEILNAGEITKKEFLLTANFTVNNNKRVRKPLEEFFKKQPFCIWPGGKNYKDYLLDVAHSVFILSPHGNGLDCHRTWEALYLGAIPIVKTSTLDPLYDGLPVLIVQEWQEVTQEFLETQYRQMAKKAHEIGKLRFDYWVNRIREAQNACRCSPIQS